MQPKIRKTKGDSTSMIDCVFLLLIFFIVSAKFITPEGYLQVYMPKDESSGPGSVTDIPEETRIFVRRGQSIKLYVDKQFMGEFSHSLSELKKKDVDAYNKEIKKITEAFRQKDGVIDTLKTINATGAASKVVIDADPNVPFLFVAECVDACASASIADVQFTGAKKRLSKLHGGVIR